MNKYLLMQKNYSNSHINIPELDYKVQEVQINRHEYEH